MELLRRSCDELGQTVIIVTHDPRAASYADRIVFLRDGHIVNDMRFEQGSEEHSAFQLMKLRSIIEYMEKFEE
jgi:putative ABC transport system ATP-binding protein